MAGWTVFFAVGCVLAALVAFGGFGFSAAAPAQIAFFLCLLAFLVSAVLNSTRPAA